MYTIFWDNPRNGATFRTAAGSYVTGGNSWMSENECHFFSFVYNSNNHWKYFITVIFCHPRPVYTCLKNEPLIWQDFKRLIPVGCLLCNPFLRKMLAFFDLPMTLTWEKNGCLNSLDKMDGGSFSVSKRCATKNTIFFFFFPIRYRPLIVYTRTGAWCARTTLYRCN